LRIKDHAEYLIRKEIRECGRFHGDPCTRTVQGKPEQDIPAQEQLPWQFEIEQLIEEWQMNGVLSKRQANLVIDHLIYEFTFREMSKQQKVSKETIRKRFHKALLTLTPYLQREYFSEDGEFLGL
jgi:DNA-directed RNA polymerase specialized sigma24 family protein